MIDCDFCNSPIPFSILQHSGENYCSSECLNNSQLLTPKPGTFTENEIQERIEYRHLGSCPLCGGVGPLDVQSTHTIWSLLIHSSFKTKTTISCRSCAVKMKIKSSLFSLFFGWWGIPDGIMKTPKFVLQDVVGLFQKIDPKEPSNALKRFAALELAKINKNSDAQQDVADQRTARRE